MTDLNIKISPFAFTPMLGGMFTNGSISGYGIIRNNTNKILQQGYFSKGILAGAPIISSYIEWTSAPEQVLIVYGSFTDGKVDGVVYKNQSSGSIYCKTGESKSNSTIRTRFILMNKTKQSCTTGTVDSSSSLGSSVFMMNWVDNVLINAFDIGVVDFNNGYEVDDSIRVDSAPVKNEFVNSIYN